MATEVARLKLLAPFAMGIMTRASEAACTGFGTPALSRPKRRRSSGLNTKLVRGVAPLVVKRKRKAAGLNNFKLNTKTRARAHNCAKVSGHIRLIKDNFHRFSGLITLTRMALTEVKPLMTISATLFSLRQARLRRRAQVY